MSIKTPPSEFPTHAFPTAASFEAFLEREHTTAAGIYLKLAKKASGIPSITGAEAVETALCYGWIDGRANGVDDNWWTVRYTPRRAKSIWSQKNVGTVARLVEEGRMRPAGLVAVDAAKADGRYARAYAGPATMATPADFTEALEAEPAAKAYFDTLNKSRRYEVLMPLATISDKNRRKKIDSLLQTMATGGSDRAIKSKKPSRSTVDTSAKISKAKISNQNNVARLRAQEGSTILTDRSPRREGLRRR